MANVTGKWEGGYVHTDASGRTTFYIRKQIGGTRYDVSTGAHTERAAFEQLKRFEADPEAYDPRGTVGPDAIWLDKELVEAFLRYSKEEKQNTGKWIREQKKKLAWWAEKLHGVDLHRVSLKEHILPALDGADARKHRITVIKALFTWLRRVRRDITLAEDPVAAGALSCIQANRVKPKKKKAIPREHVELVREHLIGGWRDALDIQTETGWHVTEVQRFAADGEIEPATKAQKEQGVAGVLVVQHKSRDQHRTAVTEKTLEAAQRLRERGGLSIRHYQAAVRSACKAAGLKTPFGPGQLRHSVATWYVEDGADLGSVATFLGHKSPSTTKKFYASFATPKNPGIVPPVLLPKKQDG